MTGMNVLSAKNLMLQRRSLQTDKLSLPQAKEESLKSIIKRRTAENEGDDFAEDADEIECGKDLEDIEDIDFEDTFDEDDGIKTIVQKIDWKQTS